MSQSIQPDGSVNPYIAQPNDPGNAAPLRPTGVSVIAVLCIIFGILGTLSGLMQGVQLAVADRFATAFVPSGEEGDAQRKWFGEIQAINKKYLIPNIASVTANTGLSVCLLIGGIALTRPTRWSQTWIRRTFLAAIVIEVLRQVLYWIMQAELHPVMVRQFDVMAPGGTGGAPEVFKSMQSAMMFVSYGMAAVWFLTKLAGYIWGRRYMNRDNVTSYIETASNS